MKGPVRVQERGAGHVEGRVAVAGDTERGPVDLVLVVANAVGERHRRLYRSHRKAKTQCGTRSHSPPVRHSLRSYFNSRCTRLRLPPPDTVSSAGRAYVGMLNVLSRDVLPRSSRTSAVRKLSAVAKSVCAARFAAPDS